MVSRRSTSKKSNKKQVISSIKNLIFAGDINRINGQQKKDMLNILDTTDYAQYVILLKSFNSHMKNKYDVRGLYAKVDEEKISSNGVVF